MSVPWDEPSSQPSMFSAEDFPLPATLDRWSPTGCRRRPRPLARVRSSHSRASTALGSWLKTSQGCCQLRLDGSSEVFCETWPRAGMTPEWDCLPASAFGAPHRRDRVWLVAYPAQLHSDGGGVHREHGAGQVSQSRDGRRAAPMADTDQSGLQGRDSGLMCERAGERAARSSRASVEFAAGIGCGEGSRVFGGLGFTERGGWESEPDVGRVAHGVPNRVDRLRGLGNAIVPQIAEWLARRILEAEGR